MLFRPLDHVLTTATKVQLLRTMLPLRSPVTGREAQRLSGIRSNAAVGHAMQELVAAGIVVRGGSPRSHQYGINREHRLEPALRALFEAEGRGTAELRTILCDVLGQAGLRDAVRSVVVFGSQARGDARPDSDLDLLVVAAEEDLVPALEDALMDASDAAGARMGLRLSPVVLSAGRVAARGRAGDPLMASVRAEGRTLFGEPFDEWAATW